MTYKRKMSRSYPVVIQSTIEHPIPAIDRTGGKKRISKYAFLNTLDTGNTVFLPKDMFPFGSVYTSITKCQKATGRKFTTRVVTEDSMKGIRIWRLA